MKGKDTMKRAVWMLAVLIGLCPLLSAAENGKSPAILLQEALYQEETEGDLDKAIELYGQVLEQAADVERLAARATYQLGLCHLKKGDEPAATEYFRKAVRDYPDQTSVVRKSKAQLDKLKPGDPLDDRPFIIRFKAKESFKIANAKQLLDVFNKKHPKGVETFRFRTEETDGQLVGRICVGDRAGKDKIVEMLENHSQLELIKANPAYTIVFRAEGNQPVNADDLLKMFNEHHPEGVSTYRYHPITKNGNSEGRISTDTSAEKDKLVEMIQSNDQLKLVQVLGGQSQGGLYDQATETAWSTIGSMYGQTCAKAGMKNLYTNSNIHFVNSDFTHWNGGYGFYTNRSMEPVNGRVRLSGTTYPHQKYYDIIGNPLDIEIVPDERAGRSKYYHIYLNLPQTLAPGQFFIFAWAVEGSNQLPEAPFSDDKYVLRMQNHFGSHAIEVFYLVLPNDLKADYEEQPTDTQTVGEYTIYVWEKEVQPDDNHVVTVYLSKAEFSSQKTEEYTQKLNQPITVDISQSPDGNKLTVQYAAIAIAEAAGVPYQWDKSAQLGDRQRRKFTDPININGTTAIQALLDLLKPVGLSFRVDEEGLYLYDPKRFEEVEILKPLEPNPLKAEDLIAEGWKLWGQRKLAEAEEKFKEAARNDPDNDGAYQGLGWAQLNQGKKQNAEVSFKKCVKLNPENSAALNGLGWIEHGQGKIDMAIRWWEKAVKASNGTATASLSGLTQVYMERKEYDKAVKYYQMWLKAEPANEDAKAGLEKAKQAMR